MADAPSSRGFDLNQKNISNQNDEKKIFTTFLTFAGPPARQMLNLNADAVRVGRSHENERRTCAR